MKGMALYERTETGIDVDVSEAVTDLRHVGMMHAGTELRGQCALSKEKEGTVHGDGEAVDRN